MAKTRHQLVIERRNKRERRTLEEAQEFYFAVHGYNPTRQSSNQPSNDTYKGQSHQPS